MKVTSIIDAGVQFDNHRPSTYGFQKISRSFRARQFLPWTTHSSKLIALTAAAGTTRTRLTNRHNRDKSWFFWWIHTNTVTTYVRNSMINQWRPITHQEKLYTPATEAIRWVRKVQFQRISSSSSSFFCSGIRGFLFMIRVLNLGF